MKKYNVNKLGFLEIQRVLKENAFNYCTDLDELQPWADRLEDKINSGCAAEVEMSARHTKNRQIGYLSLEAKHFDSIEVQDE